MRFRTAGGIITDGTHIVLVKGKCHGKWGFPKGKFYPKRETAFKAALREIKEETGLSISTSQYTGQKVKYSDVTLFYFKIARQKLRPIDTREIEETLWVNPHTFDFNSIEMNSSLKKFAQNLK